MESLNLGIERAILSSIIFDPSSFEEIASDLKANDFGYIPHKLIYESMEELHRRDMPLVEEFIRKKLDPKKVNDDDFVEILATSPIVNLSAYIKEIKERALRRDLSRLATKIKEYSDSEEMESEEIIDNVQSELYAITLQGGDKEFREANEITLSTLEHIKKQKERGNTLLTGMDTGFYELNKMTTGFGEGDLIIIAARPSMGKTAFVLNIALKALDNNEGVVFFSLEMPAEQLMLRLLSIKTSIALQNLRVGDLNDEEWGRMSNACDAMSRTKLFVDDGGMVNINQLRAKMRKLKSKHPEIGLVIIDYMQLMNGSGAKDRHLEISEISRGLKLLARELNIPIIALSQLNRGLESRSDKRPMLSDLRESGAIEQDADIIMFVYREAVYRIKEEKEKEEAARREGKEYRANFEMKNEEDAEIIIGKQRNGPTGMVKLVFQKHCTRFVDAHKEETEIVFQTISGDAKETKIEMPNI